MELLPAGPVVMIDTPGIDDDGELGKLRVEKSYQMLNRTDLAIVVIDGGTGIKKEDFALLKEIEKRKVPFIIAVNKSDLLKEHRIQSKGREKVPEESLIYVSAETGEGIRELKKRIGESICSEKNKKRIVIKIGSSSLIHEETGGLDYIKLEKLVRIISDLKNQDKDVVLVSSGAIGVGSKSLGLQKKPKTTSLRQACAAVGQGQLMMVYQRLFYEYHQIAAQVLLTFDVITSQERRHNAVNTFNELLQMDVIPVVNENDTVAIEEVDINFGDNDTLSAIVANMINADLLLLLTDIDGLYTDDPRNNPDATLIPVVERIDDKIKAMAKGAGSGYGTGGMTTKISAAKIAANSGADMLILSGDDIGNLGRALNGESVGTLFKAYKEPNFDVVRYITHKEYLQ